jgi:hypothetical protein
MLLFISHASEDKDDFVRPLAEELKKYFEVWYDEYRLTLGDSLLQKINEGLRTCDFGVVVLSRAFFSKRWPQAELDGLFALEGTSRKVILPIRKGLTPEEVAQFLPTLGGRLSVGTSDGLPKVVEAIRLAVDFSERKRQLTVLDSAKQQFRTLDQSLKEKQDAESLLRRTEGVALILAATELLYDTLTTVLHELAAISDVVKCVCSKNSNDGLSILAPYRVAGYFELVGCYANAAIDAELHADYLLGKPRFAQAQPELLRELRFKPSFRSSKQVVWLSTPEKRAYGTEELAAHLIEVLQKLIEKQSRVTSQPSGL